MEGELEEEIPESGKLINTSLTNGTSCHEQGVELLPETMRALFSPTIWTLPMSTRRKSGTDKQTAHIQIQNAVSEKG